MGGFAVNQRLWAHKTNGQMLVSNPFIKQEEYYCKVVDVVSCISFANHKSFLGMGNDDHFPIQNSNSKQIKRQGSHTLNFTCPGITQVNLVHCPRRLQIGTQHVLFRTCSLFLTE